MDFNASAQHPCELILLEHCHGYPLGGEFIRIDYCYDIPRILHCHVNPAIQRQLGGQYPKQMVDAVVAKQKYTYAINHTDNAQLMDLFTFGNYGGIWLGLATYGQLTNFNFDCVTVGIFKGGDNSKEPQLADFAGINNCQYRTSFGRCASNNYRRERTYFAGECGSFFGRKFSTHQFWTVVGLYDC